jgi:hypothetical protein
MMLEEEGEEEKKPNVSVEWWEGSIVRVHL